MLIQFITCFCLEDAKTEAVEVVQDFCQHHSLTELNSPHIDENRNFIYKEERYIAYSANFIFYHILTETITSLHVTSVVNSDLLVCGQCNEKVHKQIPAYFGFLSFSLLRLF